MSRVFFGMGMSRFSLAILNNRPLVATHDDITDLSVIVLMSLLSPSLPPSDLHNHFSAWLGLEQLISGCSSCQIGFGRSLGTGILATINRRCKWLGLERSL